MEAFNDQINPDGVTAELASWCAGFEKSWNAEIEKTVRLVSDGRVVAASKRIYAPNPQEAPL